MFSTVNKQTKTFLKDFSKLFCKLAALANRLLLNTKTRYVLTFTRSNKGEVCQ